MPDDTQQSTGSETTRSKGGVTEKIPLTRRQLIATTGLAATGLTGAGAVTLLQDEESGTSGESYTPREDHFLNVTGTTPLGIPIEDRVLIGSKDADIDLYYWMDFLCPYCKNFEEYVLPTVGRDYIASGDVRLIVLHYPVTDSFSLNAAMWGRSVWWTVHSDGVDASPVTYWEWQKAVFAAHTSDDGSWASDDGFYEITQQIPDLPADAVVNTLESETQALEQSVLRDADVASDLDLTSTPSFLFHHLQTDEQQLMQGLESETAVQETLDQLQNNSL